jgi:hypothetical protein
MFAVHRSKECAHDCDCPCSYKWVEAEPGVLGASEVDSGINATKLILQQLLWSPAKCRAPPSLLLPHTFTSRPQTEGDMTNNGHERKEVVHRS